MTMVAGNAARGSVELTWGRRYLVVRPDHYRITYSINPYMRLDRPPDHALAERQWAGMCDTLRAAGALVECTDADPECPDMTYAMNLGMAVRGLGAPPDRVVLSRMRHRQRRPETVGARRAFARLGFAPVELPGDCCFEAGDAFPLGDAVVVASGPRSDPAAAPALAALLDVRVVSVRLVDPAFYHLDLALCPLPDGAAMLCPDAFDPASAKALLARVDRPVLLSREEAASFAANAVVVGRVVLLPHAARRLTDRVRALGLDVITVDVSQFELGGGSLRCLTNPLDFDLTAAAV
jgi:N-dimethylarginine dimethylaminohydrolase